MPDSTVRLLKAHVRNVAGTEKHDGGCLCSHEWCSQKTTETWKSHLRILDIIRHNQAPPLEATVSCQHHVYVQWISLPWISRSVHHYFKVEKSCAEAWLYMSWRKFVFRIFIINQYPEKNCIETHLYVEVPVCSHLLVNSSLPCSALPQESAGTQNKVVSEQNGGGGSCKAFFWQSIFSFHCVFSLSISSPWPGPAETLIYLWCVGASLTGIIQLWWPFFSHHQLS